MPKLALIVGVNLNLVAFGGNRYFPGEPLNATFGVRKRFN